jgi:hypothetical protein
VGKGGPGIGENSRFFYYNVAFAAVTTAFSVVPVIERIWMYWIVFVAGVLAQWRITHSQSKVSGRVDKTLRGQHGMALEGCRKLAFALREGGGGEQQGGCDRSEQGHAHG